MATQQLSHKRLNKIQALAAFSPDALSSIAYASQEIYLALVIAGSAGLALTWPVGLAITGLLIFVAISYFQTIHAYPSGGGSYIVARENLGTLSGLIAAAALLIGYLLTAAVSLTAGVEAITSAFPELWPHRVILALALLAVITIINLRGTQETGTLMSIPVYLFLFTYMPMLAFGFSRFFSEGQSVPDPDELPAVSALTPFLVLRAFATGCTALTGIEAISNGVPAFKPPESKNAGQTLIAMALLMGVLFVGSMGLIWGLGIVAEPDETILSALARRLFGSGLAYLLIQISTMLILVVATNTSFAGFPRVTAAMASDGFLPRQLTSLGDRLVFANGILLLAALTAVLIVVFGGDTHALIPLFAIGVFLAFTFSQAGMVVHWRRVRGPGWKLKLVINAVGALATGITTLIVGSSRALEGAWITILAIPLLVAAFYRIHIHYQDVAKQLSRRGLVKPSPPGGPPRVVVPVSGVHRGIIPAINFARSISNHVTAVHVELRPGAGQQMLTEWNKWWPDVPLVILPSPYRSTIGPLLDFLDETDLAHSDGQRAAIVLPEFVPAKWWHNLLHNQTAWLIRVALLYRRRELGSNRAIIDVPYHLWE